MKVIKWAAVTLLLGACAVTPEQRQKQEQARREYQQNLQISLAAQCDPQTAQVLEEFFYPPVRTAQEQEAFNQSYTEKINNSMFQACYKMAWQNYISQRRLEQVRYQDWWYDHYWRYPFYW